VTTPSLLEPWRCSRCEADRAADDDFCGRCGARRPKPVTEAAVPAGAESPAANARKGSFPVARALILNGLILGAVLIAVVFGRGGGPTKIVFEPSAWRCDGTERAWVATIPAKALGVKIEWRTGGPEGEIRATTTTPRSALDRYLAADGAFRVGTTSQDAPECALDPGRYTLALRDAASNALLASGDVELAR
jgi:hypothetical protein